MEEENTIAKSEKKFSLYTDKIKEILNDYHNGVYLKEKEKLQMLNKINEIIEDFLKLLNINQV